MTNTTNSIANKKVITVVKNDKFEIINLEKLKSKTPGQQDLKTTILATATHQLRIQKLVTI